MSNPASVTHGARIAQETRQRFLSDSGRAMVALGVAIQEHLTALLNEAAPLPEMQRRRDTWTAYQSRQATWVDATCNSWQAASGRLSARQKTVRPDALELVGTEVVENKIIASRLVLSVFEKVSAELNDLRIRMKLLERAQDLENQDILHPEVLVLLMIEQWAGAGMSRDDWPLVNDVARKLLTEGIHRAYVNANEFLIKQGVLPTIELNDRVKRIAATASRVGPSAAGAFEGTRMLSSAAPLTREHGHAQGVLNHLKRLLVDSANTTFAATEYQAPTPALAAAIAVRPRPAVVDTGSGVDRQDFGSTDVARVAGELRHRSTDLKNKAQTKSEKATIEIVALMFQAILQEDRIPSGIRVWFARLQMPVLREALADPDFLGTLDHPARLLIDRMGSCVMGFDASVVNGSALETEIKRVVQVIEQYPETGRQVYQLVFEEFQAFLAKFLIGGAATQKVVSVAQQVEQKATLTIQYTIEMRNMLKELPVRNEIREFLFKIWAEVLALAAVRKGPQDAQTLGFKKAAADLVWAASAKPSRSDRSRAMQALPQLLRQLRAGMTLLGVAAVEQEAYIKTVSDTLADAFLSKTQAIASGQIVAMAERLAHLEDFVSADDTGDLTLDAHSIELILGVDAATIDVVADGGSKPTEAMSAWAQKLPLGSWFMLDHNGRLSQVRFVWRSERRHLHLFASQDGHSYLLQTGRVAAYLQAGLLSPQEEETLTVWATRDALGKLEANPERLLG